jgi:host factor-I protein
MEGESRNLQNDFFNAARKARSPVTVFLSNGKKLTGRIKSFDKFTILLESHQGELIVYKHAVSTVSSMARSVGEPGGDRERGPSPPGRPPQDRPND